MDAPKISLPAPQTTDPDPERAALAEQARPVRRIQLDLSPAHVAGGSLAAATAAALSSSLGVAGTIAGAAVISLVTAIAGALYTQSLRGTRARMRAATAQVAVRRTARARDRTHGPATGRAPSRIGLRPRRVLAGALAVFTLAITAITGYELLTGGSLSGESAGTTIGELTGGGPDQEPADEPARPGPGGDRTDDPARDPAPSDPTEPIPSDPSQPVPSDPTEPVPTEASPEPTDPAPTTPPPTPTVPLPPDGGGEAR